MKITWPSMKKKDAERMIDRLGTAMGYAKEAHRYLSIREKMPLYAFSGAMIICCLTGTAFLAAKGHATILPLIYALLLIVLTAVADIKIFHAKKWTTERQGAEDLIREIEEVSRLLRVIVEAQDICKRFHILDGDTKGSEDVGVVARDGHIIFEKAEQETKEDGLEIHHEKMRKAIVLRDLYDEVVLRDRIDLSRIEDMIAGRSEEMHGTVYSHQGLQKRLGMSSRYLDEGLQPQAGPGLDGTEEGPGYIEDRTVYL